MTVMTPPRSGLRIGIEQVQRKADLLDLTVTVILVMLGGSAILVGAVLAITGPSTPSFTLLDRLPGWPIVYGIAHLVTGVVVLAALVRRRLGRIAVTGLLAMTVGYAGVGLTVWRTWLLWDSAGRHGSEPLLTAAPVCMLLAMLCGFLALLIILMRRHEPGPARST